MKNKFFRMLLVVIIVLVMSIPVMADSVDPKFDAHEAYSRLHFTDNEMDFNLALILGAAGNGGCEIGEAFYTASRIKEGDAVSWQDEWSKMAARVSARGDMSLAGGHTVSAREQYLRSSYYYRAALISMLPSDKLFLQTAAKSREMMKKAGQLMSPPLEYAEIPFENTTLPVYFRQADSSDAPCKTLIMIGGGETYAEDLVFYIMKQAHERGYNFMTVDLPGQGVLPIEGKVFRPDMEVPMSKVLDYALNRPEVDHSKLAMYGISGGGGFVPRAAMYDSRIKAVIMNSAVVDAGKLFAAMPVAAVTPEVMETWPDFKQNITRAIAWRWGVDMNNISGLVAANKEFTFDPRKVMCPALILVGEGEYSNNQEVRRQQKECLDNLPNLNKKLVVTPADEGASNHCITENRSVMAAVVLDWLDEVFEN